MASLESLRKVSFIKYLSVLILLAVNYSISAQESTIYWQTDHRPPASILHGPRQGEGYIDRIRNTLINQLPQYQHINTVSALDTLFEDMERDKNICHPLLFVTEQRKKHAYFSIPVTITPSIRVVMKADLAQSLSLEEPIDLEQIFTSQRTFATIKGRSYGKFIDKAISKQHNNYSHAKISVTDNTRLFKLLARDRVDFTFTFPFELNYYQKYTNDTQFKAFTITGLSDYTLGSVACTKNAWGKSVINNVNKVLLQQRQKENHIPTMNYWWPEESKKDAFNRFYQDVFLKSKVNSLK
jgi:uncharacterized protein (TIGR02285 family)